MTNRMITTRIDRQKLVLGPRAPFCDRTYVDLPRANPLGFQVILGMLWRGGALARRALGCKENDCGASNLQHKKLDHGATQNLLAFTEMIERQPGYRSDLTGAFCIGSIGSDATRYTGRATPAYVPI